MTAVSRAGGLPWSRAAALGLVLIVGCRPALPAASGRRDALRRRPRQLRSHWPRRGWWRLRAAGEAFAAGGLPLRPAPGGRYLEDQRGVPFLIKGETAWLALANLTEAEQETYLADRAARGFNLVEVMLTNHDYTRPPNPVPPANRSGEQPFRRSGDLSTPDDAYFDRALEFVDRAASHGIAVLLAPNYLGFDGGEEGWWQPLIAPANTREVCAGLGGYLGARFRDRRNVLWLAGGDFAPPAGSEGETRHAAIVDGIPCSGRQPALDRALERGPQGRHLDRPAPVRATDGPQRGVPVRRTLPVRAARL